MTSRKNAIGYSGWSTFVHTRDHIRVILLVKMNYYQRIAKKRVRDMSKRSEIIRNDALMEITGKLKVEVRWSI